MSKHPGSRTPLTLIAGLLVAGAFVALGACSATSDPVDSEDLIAAPDDNDYAITEEVAGGTTLRATANVNLRKGPSTSYTVLRVVPNGSLVKVVDSIPQHGYYKIDHNGTIGWSYGKYYEIVDDGGGVSGTPTKESNLTATGNVNLRTGPSTSYSIIEVVYKGDVVTVADPNQQNGFLKLNHNGNVGWSSAKYYTDGSGTDTQPTGSAVRDQAIDRAKAAMGFSYWWGHGRFRVEGSTSSTKGSCSGSCPSCSHSGSYGGDCSGLVAKVWQVPSSNTDLTVDSHPYSTATFVGSSSQWSAVSRSNVKPGDALVYRSGGSGHIFVYSSGDGWGTMYAYECKGCAAGCVYNARSAGSSYKAIRRAGW